MTEKERQALYTSLVQKHKNYWDKQKSTLERYMKCYSSEYWNGLAQELQSWERRVEVPYSYNIIEQYVTSLFLRDPAVSIEGDPISQTDAETIEMLVNRWIDSSRTPLEDATKLALLYPNSFIRLYPDTFYLDEKNPISFLEGLCMEALNPWEVVVDQEASSWRTQRFVAVISELSTTDAKRRYNRQPSGLVPRERVFYFDSDGAANTSSSAYSSSDIATPASHLYVTIVEMYDFVTGKLTVFTTDHESGYYEFTHTTIPVEDHAGRPLIPIIPLFFAWRPDKPMIGISTMARVYPLIKEKNDLRTNKSNVVRADTRKYLVDQEVLTDKFVAQLQSPIDGLYIPVTTKKPLSSLVHQIPNASVSNNTESYAQEIDSDLATATLFAPFARGEVTKATATEIGVLSQYTSSEQSKMERQKNECLERIAQYYVRWLALVLQGINERITLEINDESKIINADIFSGKFKYGAADEDTTPLARALKNQQALTLAPQLISLGADPAKIREGLVEMFRLPKEWAEAAPPPESASEAMPQLPTLEAPATPQPMMTEGV